ncbi:MAG: hypothetical protein J7647_23395 [Cyanobacteria bacterium SBLK]|nr:hypothetical protein [Cyanobacteria bacterium SBLK]
MTIEIHEENYPFVSVKFIGVVTPEETKMYLERFSNWLVRENLFGLMLHKTNPESNANNTEDQQNAKESHKLVVNWAKQNQHNMKQYCVGMAVIDDKIPAEQQKMTPKALSSLFGCPGQFFDSFNDAEAWLQQQMYAMAEY